jgi:hypothetical protein
MSLWPPVEEATDSSLKGRDKERRNPELRCTSLLRWNGRRGHLSIFLRLEPVKFSVFFELFGFSGGRLRASPRGRGLARRLSLSKKVAGPLRDERKDT